MTPTTTLTLGQAAKLAQVGKTTLTRAIRAGRLSATRRVTPSM
jgi:excisionase family DNA binding protein